MRTDLMNIPDRIVNTTAAAVEGRGHQSHAEADHADNTEQRRDTDLAPVVEQVEPEDVTKDHNKTNDQYNTCQRVSHDPRQFLVPGNPRALDEIHDPRHLIARACKATILALSAQRGCQVNRLIADKTTAHARIFALGYEPLCQLCIQNQGWSIRSEAREAAVS